MVKTLFQMARELQPCVIFLDEVDSILKERSESEHEASRRIKTEFLLQFDGIGSDEKDRILILGATNRPQELDEAALRRFVKRIYIPLPDQSTRSCLLKHLLKNNHSLNQSQLHQLSEWTQGYSASDITALAREASLEPIRELGKQLLSVSEKNIRQISLKDFEKALGVIRPSVSSEALQELEQFCIRCGTRGQ